MKVKLSGSQLTGGVLVPLLILVVGIVGYFVVWPKYLETQAARADLTAKTADVTVREASLTGVNDLIASFQKNQADLAPVDGAIPDAPRIPELLANFDYLSAQSGLFLASVQLTPELTGGPAAAAQAISQSQALPDIAKTTKNLGIIQANVSLKGDYPGMKKFLSVLEQNLRIMDIQGLVVVDSGDSTKKLKEFTFTIQTYYQKP